MDDKPDLINALNNNPQEPLGARQTQPAWNPGGQMPAAPVGGQSSSAWKYIVIGCGGLLLFLVISLVASCGLMYFKGWPWLVDFIKEHRAELYDQLSPDHTEEQRNRFEKDVDIFLDEMGDRGLIGFQENYESVFREFKLIISDNTITVEESQRWCDNFEVKYRQVNNLPENEEDP